MSEIVCVDWTDDNGLMEHFRKWKKKVEILFKGPHNNTNDPVKANYIIYWVLMNKCSIAKLIKLLWIKK